MSIIIKRAAPAQSAILSDLAFRSKAYWGYSDEFMNQCRAELTCSRRDIKNGISHVVQDGHQLAGFYILQSVGEQFCELEGLFMEPAMIGKGYGRKLMNHAKDIARTSGYKKIIIQSDPNSLAFYLAMGAVRVGSKASLSISGRELPMLELLI